MTPSPLVTLGIATYARDTYLHEAVASCLAQTYAPLEVLVVVDGSVNPKIDDVLAAFDDPRLRIVRHQTNRGIAEAYNTIVREGRGELIAMLGDDDVCLPDRIERQVRVFLEHPDTGVVHGDAIIIDGDGVQRGAWRTRDFTPAEMLRHLVREHCTLVDPSRMVHRRVYEAVGGYSAPYTIAQDFHFWLRAAPAFRFRHTGPAPLIHLRRHDDNFSHESAREREVEQVESALTETIERLGLRKLVPELDWPLLHPLAAERAALLKLADAFDARWLPLPELAKRLRRRAAELAPAPAPRRDRGTLLMTAFGWNDAGGGTLIPRLAAKELVNRGWDVTVFHAAVEAIPDAGPYAISEREEDGVRLVGVHNRPSGIWDLGRPDRELDDPAITAAFAEVIDRVAPDVVHFHNLHNLGAALIDVAAARGVPSYFSTHNYWLVCPRAYLLRGDGTLCNGPGSAGADCATCAGGHDPAGYVQRLAGIRDAFSRGITTGLTISHAVRRTLVAQGYPEEMLDVLRQCVPAQDEAWERVGRDRTPGRVEDDVLTVGFFGSAYAHKGPQLLVEAAQRTQREIRVRIHGELPGKMREQLARLDTRGVVELHGAFSPDELPDLLAGVDAAALPSVWWDCQNLAAAECLAGRVPVLAPRMGGLEDAIRDGVDGLSFPGDDVDALAAAIDRLDSEPGLLERLQAGIEAPRGFAAYVDDLERYYAGARPGAVLEESAPLAVRWQGDQDRPTSLARINTSVCDELDALGLSVERASAARRKRAPLPHAADVEVRHQWPPDFTPPASGRLAFIQPWESGTLPTEWLEPLDTTVDELWVPSESSRQMYLDGGIPADRVHVVPNGVDLDKYTPEGPKLELDAPGLRFLFVGGAIRRKGIDVLLRAWVEAFAGRDDVTLVVKDWGADDVYAASDRSAVERMAASSDGPRVVHLTDTLSEDELIGLFRACDVLVHPYRGEGFAMPVLEAMACGLPVIHTSGGPTDEFCPTDAGWRIDSERRDLGTLNLEPYTMAGMPWMLEPSLEHLVRLLREAADASPEERSARGAIGRAAATAYGWNTIGAQYAERLRALAARPAKIAAVSSDSADDLLAEPAPRVLATPAWRGADSLGELLDAWSHASEGTLVLLADPAIDGTPEELEAHVVDAATSAGVDLESGPGILLRVSERHPGRDAALHAACDAYVPIHAACDGHARIACAAGVPVVATADLLSVLTTPVTA